MLKKRQATFLIVLLMFIFSLLPTVFRNGIMGDSLSYTGLWLMIMYLVGAYIRKHGKMPSKKLCAVGYAVLAVFTPFSKIAVFICILNTGNLNLANYMDMFICYNSPTIIAEAVFLFMLFSRLNIGSRLKKIIAFAAPLSFSVYLIHTNDFVWEYTLPRLFGGLTEQSAPLIALKTVLFAALMYVICSAVDIIRSFIFKTLKLKERVASAEEGLIKIFARKKSLKEESFKEESLKKGE